MMPMSAQNMIGIAPHAQGVRSRADSLAFVPGTAYEDYGTGGRGLVVATVTKNNDKPMR
jgi:hypothetical protein